MTRPESIPSWPASPPHSPLPPPPDVWPPAGPGAPPSPPKPPRAPVGLQNLLLGLGTALVAIAVVVFTAVNWRRMDAGFQGLVLIGLTALAAAAAVAASRRSMPATGEALGAVAVLLALADAHACRVGFAPTADPQLFWAGAIVAVSVGAWLLGSSTGIRSTRIAAAVLGQVPLLLVLGATDAAGLTSHGAVIGQCALVLVALARVGGIPRWARIVGTSWAVGAASVATLVLGFNVDGDLAQISIGLFLSAALAALVAWLHPDADGVQPVALLAASVLSLGAVLAGASAAFAPATAIALTAVVAALAVVIAVRLPATWGRVPGIVAGVASGSAALAPLAAVSAMLVAASTVSTRVWDLDSSRTAASFQLRGAIDLGQAAIALHLLALLILVVGLGSRSTATVTTVGAGLLATVAMVLAPLLLPLTIAQTVAIGGVMMVLGLAAAVLARGARSVLAAGVGVTVLSYGWATAWSVATPTLTLAVLGGGLVGALTLAVVAIRSQHDALGIGSGMWLVAATPIAAGVAALAADSSPAVAWAVAGVAGAVASIVALLLLDPDGTAEGTVREMAQAVEPLALIGHVVVLVGLADRGEPVAASVALAAGTIAFGLQAARPGRRGAGLIAAGEGLVLTWVQLAAADITAPEAYTLPLAVVLLGIGWIAARQAARRGERLGSWSSLGPALVVGLAPTVFMAVYGEGTVRPLVGLVAGAVVLVAGVFSGRRAAVDVGAATVAVLGLRQLAPVVGELPNWATIGATGVALLVVGATFEQRRRDVRAARRHYSSLV